MNKPCPFCENLDIILENDFWFSVYDKYPVNQGHILIIPKRHYTNYFESNKEELDSFNSILFKVKDYLTKKLNPQGFNVGFNVNKEVVLITDTIDTKVIEEWKPNFRAMKKVCDNLRFYYVDTEGTPKDISFLFI
jgi:diadenosine tetraphosphate (Ap4A) HIT family hydrolase